MQNGRDGGSWRAQLWLGLAALLLVGVETAGAAEIHRDFAMDSDPPMNLPDPGLAFAGDFRAIWLEALGRPEADLQRSAADAIARGLQQGRAGLSEAKPRLIAIVTSPDSHPAARFSAARALIFLEAHEAAPVLWEAAQNHPELRQLIEPSVAKWGFAPAGVLWRQRLAEKGVRPRDLLLAIRCLPDLGDEAAVPALLDLAVGPAVSVPIRVAAARSAGQLRPRGAEPNAERLLAAQSPSLPERLCAASLLERHEGEAAERLLLRLASDSEGAVAAPAWSRLNAIAPDRLLPLVQAAQQHPDAMVREQGAITYVLRPSPERVALLARMLNDPHPAVRKRIAGALLELANLAALDEPIRREATVILSEADWRGQEQSAMLLGMLDQKSAAPRLLELLESPRGEVIAASAWALRKLALPDTLPVLLDKAVRQTANRKRNIGQDGLDEQVAHLFEAMGLMRYTPADKLLRDHITDKGMGELSRGAAIWALGRLHADSPDEALLEALVARITELPDARPPEVDRVRLMSAVSLVGMQAKSTIPEMRSVVAGFTEKSPAPTAQENAALWVISKLTGEPFPRVNPIVISERWFLEPLDIRANSEP